MAEASDIERRLRALASATAAWMSSPDGRDDMARRAQEARAAARVEMSPSAVDGRLRAMARATALCLDLGRLRPDAPG